MKFRKFWSGGRRCAPPLRSATEIIDWRPSHWQILFVRSLQTFDMTGITKTLYSPVADSGIPPGGIANCPGRGGGWRQHTILPNFPENCMTIEKIWSPRRAGARDERPPQSANAVWIIK